MAVAVARAFNQIYHILNHTVCIKSFTNYIQALTDLTVRFQAYLRLDTAPEIETRFVCTVTVARNYSHAEELKILQTCVYVPSTNGELPCRPVSGVSRRSRRSLGASSTQMTIFHSKVMSLLWKIVTKPQG